MAHGKQQIRQHHWYKQADMCSRRKQDLADPASFFPRLLLPGQNDFTHQRRPPVYESRIDLNKTGARLTHSQRIS